MARFAIKHRQQETRPSYVPTPSKEKKPSTKKAAENNELKEEIVMTTNEKIALANEVLEDKPKVKRIKADKGLIERAESTKTILTDDNKELLND